MGKAYWASSAQVLRFGPDYTRQDREEGDL